MQITKARINADFNVTQPESYYDYENYKIRPGNIDNYMISQRIGRGKYSEVFEGRKGDEKIVIKALKPVRESKINREILILRNLDHPNIIKLKDVALDKETTMYSLIFDYIPHNDTTKLFENFNLEEIKLYSKQILEALAYSHSKGIIHRDIKPHNMIIDEKRKCLLLIDWGLAEFYHPEKEYSVRVASRYYKSPELLVNYPFYDYSLDLWSFGCVFAEMLFKKRPLFRGDNNVDQLFKILKLLGTSDYNAYIQKFSIKPVCLKGKEFPADRVDFKSFLPSNNDQDFTLALDLLNKILIYDHTERYTAQECLQHPFFAS